MKDEGVAAAKVNRGKWEDLQGILVLVALGIIKS